MMESKTFQMFIRSILFDVSYTFEEFNRGNYQSENLVDLYLSHEISDYIECVTRIFNEESFL